jgi:hypothetical protein
MSDYPYVWTTSNITSTPLNPDQYTWVTMPSYTYVTPTTRWVDFEAWTSQKNYSDYSAFWDVSYKKKLRSCIRTI